MVSTSSFLSDPNSTPLTWSSHSFACFSCDSVKAMWLFCSITRTLLSFPFFSWLLHWNPMSSARSKKFINQDCVSFDRIFFSSVISFVPSPLDHSSLSALVHCAEVVRLRDRVMVLRCSDPPFLLGLSFSCSVEFTCRLSRASSVGIATSDFSIRWWRTKNFGR